MNFSQDKFDAEKYVDEQMQIMDEKGIRRLVGELGDFRRVSAEEMRKSVFANYAAFIGTSKEITELEKELQQMKNLLSVQTGLIRSLTTEGILPHTGSAPSLAGGPGGLGSAEEGTDDEEDDVYKEEKELTEMAKYAEALPDILDILIAERKVERAMGLLEQAQQIVQFSLNPQSQDEEVLEPQMAVSLQEALEERKGWLAQQLEEVAQNSSVRGVELRMAVSALSRLGETDRAHQLLLQAYGERIRNGVRLVRPSGTSFGGAYTAALAQVVFSAISQAAADSLEIFGDEAACSAELLLWAQRETELCVSLLKRHVLSSAAAAGGLFAAGECVRIALGHCAILEDQGLALAPVLSRLVRPSVEEALEFNIVRIEDSVRTMAAVDEWTLYPLPSVPRLKAVQQGLIPSQIRLSSSAQRLYLLLADLVEDLLPVISLQLFGRTLDRLAQLFESYVNMLQRALPAPGPEDEEQDNPEAVWQRINVCMAADEQQQLAVLGNASALADELLPRLAVRLTLAASEENERVPGGAPPGVPGSSPGLPLSATSSSAGSARALWPDGLTRQSPQTSSFGSSSRQSVLSSAAAGASKTQMEHKEWKRRLQKAVDKLRDLLCSCLVADFMYGDDGKPILTASEYLEMDSKMRPSQWMLKPMPSPPFQAMFLALNSIAATASYVLGGRDRVVMLLLMRLAEWLMMGLMVFSTFWNDLEDAPSGLGLGSTGLQQLVFDMYFVMQVAKDGKYSSRAMRKVAEDSASKAINLFSEHSGGDPQTLLQEDWWYEAKCQEAADSILTTAQAAQEDNLDEQEYNGEEQEEYGGLTQEGADRGVPEGGSSASNHTGGEYY